MIGGGDFAPELCGFWPERRVYAGDAADGWGGERVLGAAVWDARAWDAKVWDAAGSLLLETKSEAMPGDELRVMLNQMTAEMREQFAAFVELRKGAEIASGDGDEAAGKLARADLKAAVDAMGLIVRTLEKIDQLQRQLSRDREIEIESREQVEGYAAAKGQLLEIIEQRAGEKAALIVAAQMKILQAGEEAGGDGISAAIADTAALGAPDKPGGKGAGKGGDGRGGSGGEEASGRICGGRLRT